MLAKDISSYLANHYADFLESVSELSKNDEGKSLVKDERKLYNFDKITEQIYQHNVPDSADGIYASNKQIMLVEYKSGFQKKITKENFDKKKMTCPDNTKKFCKPYADLFFTNQHNEDKILYRSIHQKAIESYMTFMQEIAFNSNDCGRNKKLVFCVVVDDYVENMEDILNGLAKKQSDTNTIERLRQSLSRFRTTENKSYYFDDIKIFSPYEFKRYLNYYI